MEKLFDDMPSLKTADFDQLLDALRYGLDNFAAIVEPFDRQFRYRRLAFSTYRKQQRGIHEICRRFTFGSKKYGRQSSPRHQHATGNSAITRNSWTAVSPMDRPHEDQFQIILSILETALLEICEGNDVVPSKRSLDIFVM